MATRVRSNGAPTPRRCSASVVGESSCSPAPHPLVLCRIGGLDAGVVFVGECCRRGRERARVVVGGVDVERLTVSLTVIENKQLIRVCDSNWIIAVM